MLIWTESQAGVINNFLFITFVTRIFIGYDVDNLRY